MGKERVRIEESGSIKRAAIVAFDTLCIFVGIRFSSVEMCRS